MTDVIEKHQETIQRLANHVLGELSISVGALPEAERRAIVIGTLATAVNQAVADARRRDQRFGELVEATFARNINLAIAGKFDRPMN